MCGIAGILYNDSHALPDRQLLHGMAGAIKHRGPDAEGVWFGKGVALAHRRLSIIDLAGGGQPLSNEDDSIHVVFNGEIYNYPELRSNLAARGHRFKTNTDTEVLVHLYEEQGSDLVNSLRGMFAFALWDDKQRRLLLARDHVGQKPLYYYHDAHRLFFASELKAILADPNVDRSISEHALESYLAYGFIPGSQSIFRHIRKLPAAHLIEFTQHRSWTDSPQRYWQLRVSTDQSRTLDDWIEALEYKFNETVASHCIADVPVGAFLSGGVDSSAIVSEMVKRNGPRLKTFAVGFEEEKFSELPFARTVAKHFGTEHIEEIVSAEACSSLDDLVKHYDEPFADASAVPTMRIAQVASRHVKVVVSGDGGDEAFGGYARYRQDMKEHSLRSLLPSFLRSGLLARVAQAWPNSNRLPRALRWKSALQNVSMEPADAYANTVSVFRALARSRLLGRGVDHGPDQQIHTQLLAGFRQGGDFLQSMLTSDIEVLLPDDFLTKVDRASMAVGLEVRPPMVDREFLQLAITIPSRYKIRSGKGKWVFKQMLEKRLPASILHRRKQGFDIPLDAWLRGPLRDSVSQAVSTHGPLASILDVREATSLNKRHQSGEAGCGQQLWTLLVLARWMETYTKSNTGIDSPVLEAATAL